MAREIRRPQRGAIARPLAAIGIQLTALAALVSIAFFIELLVRWALQ